MNKAAHLAIPSLLAVTLLAGCSSADSDATSAPSTASQRGEATDPGVRSYHAKVNETVSTVDEASEHVTVLGTVQSESHGTPSGEIDSFMTIRSITVAVDEVLSGSLTDKTVTVENGMYEWGDAGDTDVANARKYTEPGQPWLKPGESAVLVLKKVSADSGIKVVDYHSFGEAGTFRVTNGKLAATPRTDELLSAPGLPHELVGDTPDQVEQKL